MWNSLCPAVLSAASLSVLSGVCASPGENSGSCKRAGGCAQEDFLLQAKFSVHAEEAASPAGDAAGWDSMLEAEDTWESNHPLWNHDHEFMDEVVAEEQWNGWAKGVHAQQQAQQHERSLAAHENDWMFETTLDNEWIAGGGPDDVEYAKLPAADKKKFKKAAIKDANEVLKEGGAEANGWRKAWISQFKGVHQEAVHLMSSQMHIADIGQQPCRRYAGSGGIEGLYTYGAPGTCLVPLNNVRAADGKWPGLRLVTQNVRKNIWGLARKYHDPVPFVAGIIGMKHPHMDLLILPVGKHPEYYDTNLEIVRKPRSDMAFWIGGHFQPTYYTEFGPHRAKYDPLAWTMLHMSKAVSPGMNNNSRVGNAAWAAKVGWNLVAQSMGESLGRTDITYLDNTSLYQDPNTMTCTLSFVGTHHITQWLVNLRFRPGMFCGIPNVHVGFRNQVRRVLRSQEWSEKMQPALAACPKLYVTGHSLGAAQAQLVGACLQRAPAEGENGWEDYKYLTWVPSAETAKVLPPLHSAEEIAAVGDVFKLNPDYELQDW